VLLPPLLLALLLLPVKLRVGCLLKFSDLVPLFDFEKGISTALSFSFEFVETVPTSTLLAEPDLSDCGIGGVGRVTVEEGLSLTRREETDSNGGGTTVICADVVSFIIGSQS
jgi:hypothetical protein